MTGMDDDDRELLAAYKGSMGPAPEDVRDNWEEILERIEAPVPESRGHMRLVWFGLGAAAAVATLLLGLQMSTGGRGESQDAFQAVDRVSPSPPSVAAGRPSDPTPEAARVRGPVRSAAEEPEPELGPAPELEQPAVSEEIDDGPESSDERRPRPRRPARRAPRTEEPEPAPEGADSRAELELLRQVRAALAAGNHARVSALVRRYEQEFAEGSMAEEVRLLGVHALCAQGPKDAWVAAKARFERAHPASPLRGQLRDDCFP